MPKGVMELPITAVAYRRFARRCRELLPQARTEAARERLRIIAAEFDACAEELLEDPEADPLGIVQSLRSSLRKS